MAERGSSSVEPEYLNHLACEFIYAHRTMTLATACNSIAWAAPVYYVFLKSNFYFFSGPDSRHIQEALKARQVSAAISAHASTWQQIRGIQMSGGIHVVTSGTESARAIRVYLEAFPFTRTFFAEGEALDLKMFSRRFRARLYRFEPDSVYYLDNSLGFGFRKKVSL